MMHGQKNIKVYYYVIIIIIIIIIIVIHVCHQSWSYFMDMYRSSDIFLCPSG
jgi:hypothetical protein